MMSRCLSACLALLCACGDGDSHSAPDAPAADASVAPTAVTIPFAAQFGTTPFVCGTPSPDVGTPAATYTATDLRLYIFDVKLIADDGREAKVTLEPNAFQGNGVALLDFENGCGTDGTPELHTSITGTVESGSYHRVGFTLGVPADQDHLDLATATAPLDVTGMYWAWLSGYKFLKLDGTVPAGAGVTPFFLHVGASGCPGDNFGGPPTGPCLYPNQVAYDLTGFDLASKKIVLDLGAVLATVDLATNTPDTAPGCMSEPGDPECITVLPRMGINGAANQMLFKIE